MTPKSWIALGRCRHVLYRGAALLQCIEFECSMLHLASPCNDSAILGSGSIPSFHQRCGAADMSHMYNTTSGICPLHCRMMYDYGY